MVVGNVKRMDGKHPLGGVKQMETNETLRYISIWQILTDSKIISGGEVSPGTAPISELGVDIFTASKNKSYPSVLVI